MYRLQRLEIENVGIIERMDIAIDQPMLAFFGDVMQGKTTVLTSVRLLFGGSFPADIIRHGQKEAHVQLTWDGGSLRRELYVGRDGEAKARPISFVEGGVPVRGNVVERIKGLLNPFLLDQDYLIRMNDRQRAEFLIGVLGVETSDLDTELAVLEAQASTLRAEIKAAGDIDLVPVDPPGDERAIRAQRANLREQHAAALVEVQEHNVRVQADSGERVALEERLSGMLDKKAELGKQLAEIVRQLNEVTEAIAEGRERLDHWPAALPMMFAPPEPDLTAYDEQLADVRAQAVRYEAYQQRVKKAGECDAQRKQLAEIEAQQRGCRTARLDRLVQANDRCPVQSLQFDSDGQVRYEGAAAGMMSHSQMMRLSSAIAACYPPGLGLELLDRGESLGKSIWSVVERAKAEQRTILATIVADRPAVVPDDVGVYVVEQGRLVQDEAQPVAPEADDDLLADAG